MDFALPRSFFIVNSDSWIKPAKWCPSELSRDKGEQFFHCWLYGNEY